MQVDHAPAAPPVFWAGRAGVIAVGACVASLALTLGVVTVLDQVSDVIAATMILAASTR